MQVCGEPGDHHTGHCRAHITELLTTEEVHSTEACTQIGIPNTETRRPCHLSANMHCVYVKVSMHAVCLGTVEVHIVGTPGTACSHPKYGCYLCERCPNGSRIVT